jgi:signal transduction histidine kinase
MRDTTITSPAGRPDLPSARHGAAGWLGSLQARLSAISVLLFALILGFGLFTIYMFNDVNVLTDDLRQRWLPSTRVLGDLNNDTSDYRAAEGDALLALNETDRAAREAEIVALGAGVHRDEHEYERIFHTFEDLSLYGRFARAWSAYQLQAARVLALAKAGQQAQAVALYRTASRSAYNAASDGLGVLTARNVDWARAASADTARAYVQARWLIIAALCSAGILLAAALSYIRRWISTPLVDLAHTMRLLAANHTDIELMGLQRHDEIGEMARAVRVFRANAIELIQSQQGLAQQAAMLEQKLAYEQQLTLLQRNFVVMISHEFRTPLTVIDAHAQRLVKMKDRIEPGELADRVVRIRTAVQRITNLMDNLLISGRLIDGEAKLIFNPTEMDLAALLHDVCVFHREVAPNATICEAFKSAPLPLVGDRKLLFQTFSNLLSNAIKYSPEPIDIYVTAWRDERNTAITIADRGLGIPPRDLPELFTRYYRGSNVAGIVGTGVGLYLVKTVVELHGGEVTVESTIGQGSCFTITIPNPSTSA